MKIWNISGTGNCVMTLEGHSGGITCCSVFPAGYLVSGSIDETLRVWNIDNGKCESTINSEIIYSCDILSDGRLVTRSADEIRIWN